MKIAHSKMLVLLAMTTALVTAACGGGDDDDAGSLTAFSVSPDKITYNDGVGCASVGDLVGTVQILGGAAPYRVTNTLTAFIRVDKTTVGDRNGTFNIFQTGFGCAKPAIINVIDNNGRMVKVEVNLGATTP